MKSYIVIASIITTLFSATAQADFELGFRYYQNKEFAKAFKEFTYSASIGDKDAQKNIGVMYYRGEGVTKSPALAYAWLKLSNTPESPEKSKTFNAIAKKITPEETSQGEQEFIKLKPYTNELVNEKLAPLATEGTIISGPKILKSIAPKFPQEAISAGDVGLLDISLTVAKDGSVRDFVVLNKEPRFVQPSLKALRQHTYQPAQINGQSVNFYNHTSRYVYSINNSKLEIDKIKKSLKDQRIKADTGDAGNMLVYGLQNDLYKNYLRISDDKEVKKLEFENPNPWYHKSAIKGNATAAFILGTNQFNGLQCKQNINAGAAWLERAASQGSPDAQFVLGAYYYDGTLLPLDEEKGIYWLQKAALAGNANAAVKLARIYACSPSEAWFKPHDAQVVFNTVKDDHLDQLSYYEVKAAVAAANSDFKTALAAQNKAIELASSYKLNLPAQELALKKYQQNQTLRER
ncbi:MAG: hypothetical protein RL497_2341 [Pseudomonadota bacterium]|jgi:TPR repeat protein